MVWNVDKLRVGTTASLCMTVLASCSLGEETANASPEPEPVESAISSPPFADSDPLPYDELLISETLGGETGPAWIFAHDMNFNSLALGRVLVFDPLSENRNFKGQISAGQMASFIQAPQRSELLVAETYYSRGVRGDRTDVVTIYDLDTLAAKAEIVLPNNSRGINVTQKGNFRLSNDGELLFVFDFTPASGVTIIDLGSRSIVNTIETPGCMLIYPSGPRGFATLCSDGTMLGIDLDEDGQISGEFETESFNDIDNHPMFMKSTRIGDIEYWPTFSGRLQSVVLGGGTPQPIKQWDFVGDADFLPSGWQVITSDVNGLIYILMREGAGVGDHKFGGREVWVLDPVAEEVVSRLKFDSDLFSIEATREQQPHLIVTSGFGGIGVHALPSGDHIRTIDGFLHATPFVLHASEFGQ